MAKYEFESTQNHLRNTMTKQTGSIQKAFLESVMNSKDAGASYFHLNTHESETTIEDDGSGMTEDEIQTYFRYFGFEGEDQSEKDFGKFRMGRGQMFNFGVNIWETGSKVIVVNIREEKTTVPNFFKFSEDDEDIIEHNDEEVVLDSSGLGFHVFDAKNHTDGCVVRIKHYTDLEDVEETLVNFKELARFIPFVHNMEVKVNGAELDEELDFDEETELAYYMADPESYSNYVKVYNQGAYVKEERLNKTPGIIVTKKDLDVNFARNDIFENCPVWTGVQKEYDDIVTDKLVNTTDLSKRQRIWLISQCKNNATLRSKIKSKPLVDDVIGGSHSIGQLAGRQVGFANKSEGAAQRLMKDEDVIILDKNFEAVLTEVGVIGSKRDVSSMLDDHMSYGGQRYTEDNLSKRRKDRLQQLQWAFNQLKLTPRGNHLSDTTLEVGISKSDDVWRDGNNSIVIDKNALNSSKQEVAIDLLHQLVTVAAADGDTRRGIDDDYGYNARFRQYMERYPDLQNELI